VEEEDAGRSDSPWPDGGLVDAAAVARMLRLDGPYLVHLWAAEESAGFPKPVVVDSDRRQWIRAEIVAWARHWGWRE
jgi:predicted DNA-binding transcriptional regulator AlpA